MGSSIRSSRIKKGKQGKFISPSSLKVPSPRLSRPVTEISTLNFTLPNGLRIIFHQIPIIDMVSVYLRVNTGSNYEGRFLGSGISHFLEHCMFLGSKKFPSKDEFSNVIQRYGGIDLNAYTGETSTCYQFSVLSHYLTPALDALHDFTFYPLLRKKDIEEERGTIVSEMDIYDDKSADWFYRLIFSRIFAGEPGEIPIIGLRKYFHGIKAKDLREYHRDSYRPDNLTLCLVGGFDIASVKRYLKKTFSVTPYPPTKTTTGFFPGGQRGYWSPSSWSSISPISSEPSTSTPISKLRITETCHHRVEFVRVVMVWEGCDFYHPENYTLDIISHILASGRGSLLYEILKEKLDQVEKVSSFSFQTHPHSPGKFFVEYTLPQPHDPHDHTEVTHAITQVTERILGILSRIGKYLTQELLDGSRNTFLKSFIDEKDDYIDVASTLSHSLNYFGHLNYEKEYFNHINRLTCEEVTAVVKKYLHPQPHLFLLLPDKIFKGGNVYPKAERISAQELDGFEQELGKGISEYVWNQVSPQKEKEFSVPAILSVRNLAPTHRTKLGNQTTLLHKKITGLPKACLQLIFPGGSVLESLDPQQQYRNGSFNLLSQMFFGSNRIHSKKEIADALRHNGITYSSYSGENTFGIGFSFLKDRLPGLLACLEPILSNTRYRESDFTKEKKDVIYALKKSKEDSFREAMRHFKKHFFGENGYALNPIGSEDTIPGIGSREIIGIKKKFVTASRLTAHLCGDFSAADIHRVRDSLERSLELDSKGVISPFAEKPNFSIFNYRGEDSLISETDPGGQSHFLMGYRTPALSEDNGALKLVSHYLEGIGGPLFKLRSSNFIKGGKSLGGRCYRLGCSLKTAKHYGMLVFYASFRKEAAEEYLWALEAFQKELDKLRKKLIDEKEIERAKTSLLAEMKAQSIKYHNLSFNEALLEVYELGHDFGDKEMDRLQALTAEELREAVNLYLRRDNFLAYTMRPAIP